MKKIKALTKGLIIVVSLIFLACNNDLSLQQFIVKQQEKQDVISFDLSSSLLAATDKITSQEDINTLKSIKKINILAYQLTDSTKSRHTSEKQHIKNILKQEKYQELIRYGKGNQEAKIYLVGNEEALNELIVFANSNDLGWLIVRVLGKNMKPEKIIKVMQQIDFKDTDLNFSKIKNILKNKI